MSTPSPASTPAGPADRLRQHALERALSAQYDLYSSVLEAITLLSLAQIAEVTRLAYPAAHGIVCEPGDQPGCDRLVATSLIAANGNPLEPDDTWRDATWDPLYNLSEHTEHVWGLFGHDHDSNGAETLFVLDEIATADDGVDTVGTGPFCQFCHRQVGADGHRAAATADGENPWVCDDCWDPRLS